MPNLRVGQFKCSRWAVLMLRRRKKKRKEKRKHTHTQRIPNDMKKGKEQ